jgi:hypothetical protein
MKFFTSGRLTLLTVLTSILTTSTLALTVDVHDPGGYSFVTVLIDTI